MKKITIILVCTLMIVTSITAVGQIKDISISKKNNVIDPLTNG